MRVARLDGEVLERGVAPARMADAPRGPPHEQDRVEAEVAQAVEAINDRVQIDAVPGGSRRIPACRVALVRLGEALPIAGVDGAIATRLS